MTADRGRDALLDENFLAWLLAFGTDPETGNGARYGTLNARQYAALMLASYRETPEAYPAILGERGVYLPDGLDGLAAAVEALPLTVVALHGGPDRVDRAEVLRLIKEAKRPR